MFNRKDAKKAAKKKLKSHYLIFVFAILIAAWLGTGYSFSLSSFSSGDNTVDLSDVSSADVIYDLMEGSLDTANEKSDQIKKQDEEKSDQFGLLQLGHKNGVLASFVNTISSGSIFVLLYQTVSNISGANTIASQIVIVLAFLVMMFVRIFIKDVYHVVYRRIFLEGYNYSEVKRNRFLFIFKVRKWLQVTWDAIVVNIYSILWGLTIIGGVIKEFSYSQVYYILAENPSLKPNQAITLSRKMMDGHKWELFKTEVTFLGWYILEFCTLGLSGIFFSNPYHESFRCEYYVYVRQLAIEKKIDGYEYLNDIYLYENPTEDALVNAYGDLKDVENKEVVFPVQKGIKGFFAKLFGVVLKYDEESNQFQKALFERDRYEIYKDIFNYENYPSRLCPLKESKELRKDTVILAERQYSITNLVLSFFLFSFIGWVWEVSLHVIKDGVFVNRGVLHGPWLPVYGSGVLLILLILYRFRKSVPLEFVSAVILCGIVEYYTSVYLEMVHHGMRWWDYTGYFLNINGRVCAEGLFVFGLGGCVAVYLAVPLMDNLLRKVNAKVLTILAIVLTLLFVGDSMYSKNHPNTGKGITDYDDSVSMVIEDKEFLTC